MGRKIFCYQLQIKTENWTETISKLAAIDIKTAPREFYSTMKKLGGMGRGSNHVTKMEYNKTTANSEEAVADLMAQYVEDTFQPLQEPDLDYTHFNRIEQEWLNSLFALDNSTPTPILPNTSHTIGNLNPFNITWPSPHLRNQPYQDHTTSDNTANPTKHQRE